MKLFLPETLRAGIERQARTAFPRECCGLIEGFVEDSLLRATQLHPARNLADMSDRFEIDPADHMAAAKSARARNARIIGCYHSHPRGEPRPSKHDLAGAEEENFLWLIVATDGKQCRLAGYVYRAPDFIKLLFGADCVTSSSKERS